MNKSLKNRIDFRPSRFVSKFFFFIKRIKITLKGVFECSVRRKITIIIKSKRENSLKKNIYTIDKFEKKSLR